MKKFGFLNYFKLYKKYVDLQLQYNILKKKYDDIVYCIDNDFWELQKDKGCKL